MKAGPSLKHYCLLTLCCQNGSGKENSSVNSYLPRISANRIPYIYTTKALADSESKRSLSTINQCQEHFNKKRLTSGRQGNAFSCYRKILSDEPDNFEALEGIENIKNTKPITRELLQSISVDSYNLGPVMPTMEKHYWFFINSDTWNKADDGLEPLHIGLYFEYSTAGKKSGYGMLSEYNSTTKNFIHKDMWIDN